MIEELDISKEIIEGFIEGSTEKTEEIIQENTESLKDVAETFIKNYNKFKDQVILIEQISERLQKLRHQAAESKESLPEEYQNLLNQRKNIMTAKWYDEVEENASLFQQQLNNFLGQRVETVYVTTSGRGKSKQVHIYNLPQGKFIKPGISSSNKLIGRYQASLRQLRKEKIKELSSSIDKKYKTSLDKVYLTALDRYEELRKREYHGFYWLNSKKKYETITVSNKGDIGEAYLNAALTQKVKLGQNLEGNLKRFAKLVAQVDSTSGLLQGDFEKDGIQYAAKAEGASTLKMQQMINIANEILSGKIYDEKTLKEKQKNLLQQGSLRNFIKTDVDEEIRELLKILI